MEVLIDNNLIQTQINLMQGIITRMQTIFGPR